MAASEFKRARSQSPNLSQKRRRRTAASYPITNRRKTTPKKNTPFIPAPLPPSAQGLQHAVFDTTELLENILVHLLVEDIYKAREVNKNWKEVIHTSPSILCKLFVNIQEPQRIWTKSFSDEEGQVSIANPGAKLSKPERFGFADTLFLDTTRLGVIGGDHLNSFPDGRLHLRPVRLNPFLKLLIPRNVKNGRRKDTASQRRVTNGRVEEGGISLRPADAQRIRDWIGMEDLFMSAQLTDPPTQVVTVSQRVPCTAAAHHRGGRKCSANGRVDWELECEPKMTRRGGGIHMKDVIFSMLNLRRGVGRLDLPDRTKMTSPELVYMHDVLKQARLEGHEMGGEVEYVVRLHSVVVPSEEEWASMEAAEAETEE
ncbi:hypothetical protein CBER1_03159 [Cercospora berteroae]|uniref:F-box domain-containing protein n=1 Tax=Cercospora berteroae TaxID=357750 RepID=A0A2S6CL62_9PEZI|nr:hypothetical protein CBER1_03159 [Cercospora berteroae]